MMFGFKWLKNEIQIYTSSPLSPNTPMPECVDKRGFQPVCPFFINPKALIINTMCGKP